MSETSFMNIWIEFQGNKFTISDFIQRFKNKVQEPLPAVIEFIENWQSNSLYISQQTSGSTGTPKAVKISKSQIEASAIATLNTLGIKSGDLALLCINPEYIGGKMMIARAIIGGLNISIGPINGNPLHDFEAYDKIDFFSFVPYQFERILDESPDKIQLLDSSKAIILGGAPVSENLAEKIKLRLKNAKVYSTYGMTETVSHVALKLINSDKIEAFKALDKIKFSVDERNCLVIFAPEISGQDKLITNDVVDLISPTEFHWLGRYDFVINSGGIKIHPEIIEHMVAELLADFNIDNRFFAFGLPDEKLGESLNLIIEGKCDKEKVLNLLKENLKAYHAPKRIYTVAKFIETASGKINRMKTIENKETV